MSGNVRLVFISNGFRQILASSGTRSCVDGVARGVSSGVRSCGSHVRTLKARTRHISIVGLDPKDAVEAYEGRRELEAAL